MFIGIWGQKERRKKEEEKGRERREGSKEVGVREWKKEGEDLNNICPTHGIR